MCHREALRAHAGSPTSNPNNASAEPLALEVSQQLVLSIKEQTKLLESVTDKCRNARKEKQTKWSDLLDSMQNLILMASLVNSGRIPNKPTVLCHKFYTKKVAKKSQAFLNKTLVAAGCIAFVDNGCVLALFSGSFVRDVADLPAIFPSSLSPQPNPTPLCCA